MKIRNIEYIIILLQLVLLCFLILSDNGLFKLLLVVPLIILTYIVHYIDKKEYYEKGFRILFITLMKGVLILAYISQCLAMM